MARKKSIAESVEHLLKPKSLVQSDSEDEADLRLSESLANVNARQRPSGILRKQVPLLHELDKKYKGIASSRKDLEEEDDDSESEPAEESDASEEEEEESDQEDNDLGISDFISQFKSKVQKDVAVEDSDREEEEEDGGGSEEEDQSDEDDSEGSQESDDEDVDAEDSDQDVEDDEEEDDDMEADEEDGETASSSLKIMQPTQENSVQKGQAVRTQLDLWERILETRIKIQPVLNKANGFPDAELFCQLQVSSEQFSALAKETESNVGALLDNLIELQNAMMGQFSETQAILKSGLYKRKFVDQCKEGKAHKKLCLDYQQDGGAEQVFKTYRNSVIQKWSDRTKVTNARNSKELLLNHNVISQIEGVLLNKPDLIKNSQTVKGTYQLFGSTEKAKDAGEEKEATAKWCPEIYDDTDFYHQMLRELIEYKSNSSTNPVEAARNYSELQKLRTKIKKQVDQKASKGRKIRYVVHKKITSFMAPFSDSHWTEEATQELFSSLFGNYEKSLNAINQKNGVEADEDDQESDMRIL